MPKISISQNSNSSTLELFLNESLTDLPIWLQVMKFQPGSPASTSLSSPPVQLRQNMKSHTNTSINSIFKFSAIIQTVMTVSDKKWVGFAKGTGQIADSVVNCDSFDEVALLQHHFEAARFPLLYGTLQMDTPLVCSVHSHIHHVQIHGWVKVTL